MIYYHLEVEKRHFKCTFQRKKINVLVVKAKTSPQKLASFCGYLQVKLDTFRPGRPFLLFFLPSENGCSSVNKHCVTARILSQALAESCEALREHRPHSPRGQVAPQTPGGFPGSELGVPRPASHICSVPCCPAVGPSEDMGTPLAHSRCPGGALAGRSFRLEKRHRLPQGQRPLLWGFSRGTRSLDISTRVSQIRNRPLAPSERDLVRVS